MKSIAVLALALLCCGVVLAQPPECSVRVRCSDAPGQDVVLYTYDDLLTRRRQPVAHAALGTKGEVTLTFALSTPQLAHLRVGLRGTDLHVAPKAQYEVQVLPPDPLQARSMGATAPLSIEFLNMEPLDRNALTSNMNEHLDMFLAERFAADESAGMRAVEKARNSDHEDHDTTRARASGIAMLDVPPQALDSFELLMRRYYAGVQNEWFQAHLNYALAGLHLGPQARIRELYDQYLKERTVRYDDVEYLRFVRELLGDQLRTHTFRAYDDQLLAAVRNANMDSLEFLYAQSTFGPDPQLRELLLLDALYGQANDGFLDRQGVRALLRHFAKHSAYTEHRLIAENMLWDLTAVRTGDRLPELHLRTAGGMTWNLDSAAAKGPMYVALTADWCTYCELELSAMQKLHEEYSRQVQFVSIFVNSSAKHILEQERMHPERTWTQVYTEPDPVLLDRLRVSSLPAFFLLQEGVLTDAPAKGPSSGIAAKFHALRMQAEERDRTKFRDGAAPPKPK
jgi:thiol-disulfide isomerase/thioredoxin